MSRKNVSWSALLILIVALAVSASAQHFEKVKGTLVGVAAGRNEVFGFDAKSNVWRYHATTQSFGKIKGASLNQIAVGGGTLTQLDDVWGISASQNVFHFNYSTKTFDEISGAFLTQITVGVGNEDSCHPYEVWGIASNQEVFRFDYCSLQFNQSPGSFLTSIASGGGDVWGIINTEIFHYSFSQGKFVQVTGALTQINVGVNDVWGVTGGHQAYRYDPATNSFNLISTNASTVSAGGDGVWMLDTSGNVWRFDSSAEKFVQTSGILKNIAVGSGTGVFGVTSASQVFTFVRP
jgi:hypothetical protein